MIFARPEVVVPLAFLAGMAFALIVLGLTYWWAA